MASMGSMASMASMAMSCCRKLCLEAPLTGPRLPPVPCRADGHSTGVLPTWNIMKYILEPSKHNKFIKQSDRQSGDLGKVKCRLISCFWLSGKRSPFENGNIGSSNTDPEEGLSVAALKRSIRGSFNLAWRWASLEALKAMERVKVRLPRRRKAHESTLFVFEASEPDPEFVVIPEVRLNTLTSLPDLILAMFASTRSAFCLSLLLLGSNYLWRFHLILWRTTPHSFVACCHRNSLQKIAGNWKFVIVGLVGNSW